MKLLYESLVNVIFLKTAATAYGRIFPVFGKICKICAALFNGSTRNIRGG